MKTRILLAAALMLGFTACHDDDDDAVEPLKNMHNGHEYVDLGLPSGTLWATCNIGASSATEPGDFYAWGELEPYYSAGGTTDNPTWKTGYSSGYNWNSYKFMDKNVQKWSGCNKYTIADDQKGGMWYDSEGNFIGDNKTELDDADDVAVQSWGGKWQMPTKAILRELLANCYWVWTTSYNGKSVSGYIVYKAKNNDDKGRIITSDKTPSSEYDVTTDDHLFFPSFGIRVNDYIKDNLGTFYWTRTIGSHSHCGTDLIVRPNESTWNQVERSWGLLIRPVVPGEE